MASPTIKPSANIAIVWGTTNGVAAGTNTNNGINGIIIDSLTITPKNGDPVDIEDGAGFAAVQVLIEDGFSAKATAVYDSNRAMPKAADNITLVVPKMDGANNGTASVNATFWSWGFTRSRKKESMIELNFTRRPGIDA